MTLSDSAPRKIVLTGVSRGLGAALLPELIDRGHSVAGCARSVDAISDLRATCPNPHHFTVLDLSEMVAIENWCEQLLDEFGVPDLVINNAATINSNASLWEVPPAEFDAVIDINIKSVFHVIRGLLPPMIDRGQGVIVNLSSGWGRSTSPEVAPYCTSKWAIEGMTRALASELPAGLAAVPLNPGIINTDMLQQCFGEAAQSYPDNVKWAAVAAPFILGLSAADNGQPLSVPDP
ncbi:MAG: SDR family oxidoreductase [Gammaproteobacteria bacterium]|nr:SDR family oxidoreductase [Gammaproteobacteria bacterium]